MKGRAPRGQAVVELALVLLVLVPIFLYVLFTEDLMQHKLMLQEAVVSTPWDFVGVDYERFGGDVDKTLGAQARFMWCDYSSAYNSYDPDFDCGTNASYRQHPQLAARASWSVESDGEGENEVHCSRSADVGADYPEAAMTPGLDDFKRQVNRGGAIACTASVGVVNRLLPRKLFTPFTDIDLSPVEKSPNSSDSDSLSSENFFRLKRQRFAVVHDSWAQTSVAQVEAPGSGSVLGRRTQYIYGSWMGQTAAFMPAMNFVSRGIKDKLIGPQAMPVFDSPMSDNLMEANVAFGPPGHTVDNHYTSPWKDWDDDAVEKAYEKRGSYYLGQSSEP